MYVQRIYIDYEKCASNECCAAGGTQECIKAGQGQKVFAINQATNQAYVKIAPIGDTEDITDPILEVEAGWAIDKCPKAAIWGRGQGEGLKGTHQL